MASRSERFLALTTFTVAASARNTPVILVMSLWVACSLGGMPPTCLGILLIAPVSTRPLRITVCAIVSALVERKAVPAPSTTTAIP